MKTEKLTTREIEITQLIAFGNSQKEIANTLHISAGTVDAHLKNIKAKTGLQKVTELTAAWFVGRYNLPTFDLPAPLRRRIAAALVALSLFQAFVHTTDFVRVQRPARTTGRIVNRGQRTRSFEYLPLTA